MPLINFYNKPELLQYIGRSGGDSGDSLDPRGTMDVNSMTPEQRKRAWEVFSNLTNDSSQADYDAANAEFGTNLVKHSADPVVPLRADGTLVIEEPETDEGWLSKAWDAATGYLSDAGDYISEKLSPVGDSIESKYSKLKPYLDKFGNYVTNTEEGGLLSDVGGILAAPFAVSSALAAKGREKGKPVYEKVGEDENGNPIYDYKRDEEGKIVYDNTKVLMDDGVTWRDRNFMDTAFDVLRGVDNYIDPATKYFRGSLERASTHPMGWSLAARDPEGSWANAMKGAVQQRSLDLKERGQGSAVNTMMYDINKYINENFASLDPDARKALQEELMLKGMQAMKSNQSQINIGNPQDMIEIKGLLRDRQNLSDTVWGSEKASREDFLKNIIPEGLSLTGLATDTSLSREAFESVPINAGQFGGGSFGDTVRRVASRHGLNPEGAAIYPLMDRTAAQMYANTRDLLNKGTTTEGDAKRIDKLMSSTADSPIKFTVASGLDAFQKELYRDAYYYSNYLPASEDKLRLVVEEVKRLENIFATRVKALIDDAETAFVADGTIYIEYKGEPQPWVTSDYFAIGGGSSSAGRD